MPLLNLPQLADPRLLSKLKREPLLTRVAVGACATWLIRAGVPADVATEAIVFAWCMLVASARSKVTPV